MGAGIMQASFRSKRASCMEQTPVQKSSLPARPPGPRAAQGEEAEEEDESLGPRRTYQQVWMVQQVQRPSSSSATFPFALRLAAMWALV